MTTTNAEKSPDRSAASDAYADAYRAHYESKDLPRAIQLYLKLIAAHPASDHAGYCRAQISNIARSIVPAEALLKSQIDLVLAQFVEERPAEESSWSNYPQGGDDQGEQ